MTTYIQLVGGPYEGDRLHRHELRGSEYHCVSWSGTIAGIQGTEIIYAPSSRPSEIRFLWDGGLALCKRLSLSPATLEAVTEVYTEVTEFWEEKKGDAVASPSHNRGSNDRADVPVAVPDLWEGRGSNSFNEQLRRIPGSVWSSYGDGPSTPDPERIIDNATVAEWRAFQDGNTFYFRNNSNHVVYLDPSAPRGSINRERE